MNPSLPTIDVTIPEQVVVADDSTSNFFSGFSGGIVDGGLFLASYADASIGARIKLTVRLPNGEFKAEGVVRWLRPVWATLTGEWPGLGLQLVGLDADAVRMANGFMNQRAPEFYVA